MTERSAYSRPLSAAGRLSEHAADHHRFIDKRVLLTGETHVLACENGRECFLTSLHLLPRICRHVSVSLPSGFDALRQESRTLLQGIQFDNEVAFLPSGSRLSEFDAILNIGSEVRPGLRWTTINSNGWTARVTSGSERLPNLCSQTNPVGAMAAGCLGVAEVFKRRIDLRGTRGNLLDGLFFSLYSYESGIDDPGPKLPETLLVELLLVGVGAIGNGVVHLFRQLPMKGRIYIVDREIYVLENLGTCMLIGPAQVGVPKAQFVAGLLHEQVQTQWWNEELTEFRNRMGREIPYPTAVLNCVDNIDARHEVQGLWPDLIIDGAIGDFACQVSVHAWGVDVACLRCMFKSTASESADQRAARATGLSLARVKQPFALLTQEDVMNASLERQEWLSAYVGEEICSVAREGIALEISRMEQDQNFQPSIPFVACFSASMIVGELIKEAAGLHTVLEPRFQCDLLRGPHYGLLFPQGRGNDCLCVTRRRNIELVRSERAASAKRIP